MIWRPLISTLFPYTTLFRSRLKIVIRILRVEVGVLQANVHLHVGVRVRLQHVIAVAGLDGPVIGRVAHRSEEHTSELQSHSDLVCRLLLEKKKNKQKR